MMLLIDSGNTRIKVGVAAHEADAGETIISQLAGFDHGGTRALHDWLASLPVPLTSAWGVNVAGATQQAAIDAACTGAGLHVAWQTARPRLGRLVNGYAHPERLGADRWAALVGIGHRLPAAHPPVIMATFGTATTIDVIGPDDIFTGGMILPGPAMMRRALNTGTSDLPLASGPPALWPADTDSAIASGVASAQAGALARQVLAAQARWGAAPRIYASGGGWPEIEQEVRRLLLHLAEDRPAPYVIEPLPHPVLDGLACMAALADVVGQENP